MSPKIRRAIGWGVVGVGALTLLTGGFVGVNVAVLGTDRPVGHWRADEARVAYEKLYDDAMKLLPPPTFSRDLETGFGTVRAYTFDATGPGSRGRGRAPFLLLPGFGGPASTWYASVGDLAARHDRGAGPGSRTSGGVLVRRSAGRHLCCTLSGPGRQPQPARAGCLRPLVHRLDLRRFGCFQAKSTGAVARPRTQALRDEAPTSVVLAGRSVAHDAAEAQQAARSAISDLTIRIEPDASHALHIEHHPTLNREILEFSARHDA